MQNGELLVAERLSPLGKLRLQKGWRCSANKVLRAIFRLCRGGTQAEAQDRHEADYRRENKSYHRTLPVGQGLASVDADAPGIANPYGQCRADSRSACRSATPVVRGIWPKTSTRRHHRKLQ